MSDAAVGFLLDNLKQLVQDNFNLIKNVRDEVDGLIRDLPLLKALIEVSTETGSEDKVVEALVTRIRDLTFEAEDAIDCYTAVEATGQKGKKWFLKVFGGLDHAPKLHKVAKKVQDIREEVDKLNQNPMFVFKALQAKDPAGRTERRLPDVEKDNVVGFDEATTTLIDRLTADTKELQVISIIGMPGLGKTTLANKVFNDPRVSHEFSTLAWIYVSQTYTKRDLLLSILKGGNQVTTAMSDMDEGSLVKEVRGYLSWKYLIVVDDVWEEKDWDSIKEAFPNHKNGSRILLTSRNEPVAVHAHPLSQPYKLDFLTYPQSWELLQIKVFGQKECPQESQDLIPVGKEIAVKCCGLPLAVVIIAGMLQTKKRKDWWETVAQSVNAFLVMNEEQCLKVLALSYNHLPPHLKACFLYFGVFPEGYEIPAWILIRLWIAERFVQKIGDVCLEKMAEDHLEDLAARNLVLVIQRSFSGRIKTCRIHDMLRDLCLRKALEESFLLEIKEDGSNSSSYPTPGVSVINRRLCIHSGVSKYISSKPCGLRVRSFLCFAKNQVNLRREHVGYIPEEFKLLRVYHIQPISSPRFPSEIEKLVHLTYVAFSGDFTTIPAAISNLWNLQTLIVETSSRTTRTIDIKADILKMSQFRHLHTNKASQLHSPVAKKSKDCDNASLNKSLQTLTTITPKSCTEDVLGQTTCIKKLGIRGKLDILEGKGWSLFDNLTKLQQLVTLKLLNDAFPDPPSESKLQGLPQWNKFPPNLERLTLADTFLDWDHMNVLGMLPKLEELKLKDNAFTGVSWTLVDRGFKKLKALQIWKTDLVYWEAKADHFPSLQHIVLKDCRRLWEIPPSLGNVKTLRTIKLHETSRSAATSARKIKEQQQESKVYNGLKVDIFPPDL
ncbi:putative late blight resistance protein homolog R1C-3 [Rhododendron vialii]|uniref:putative late blight resistance protein homolog R1C-3 n=1 Tax=Rhododendron vialii TaxID=182163 RepID=UPI00265FC555|nr:putative late blight resistance protein homolog R1C-3 [Rhododendron vialii]